MAICLEKMTIISCFMILLQLCVAMVFVFLPLYTILLNFVIDISKYFDLRFLLSNDEKIQPIFL